MRVQSEFSFLKRCRWSPLWGGLAFSALLVGCDGQVHLEGGKTTDFASSQVTANGPAPADGASQVILSIHLRNSDGTPVVGFKPIYEIVSGSGVQGGDCAVSDSAGLSTCALKATTSGVKRVSITNVKIALVVDVTFSAMTLGGALTGPAPAGSFGKTSASGYAISGSLGSMQSNVVKTSASGWKLYGGPEGNALSR